MIGFVPLRKRNTAFPFVLVTPFEHERSYYTLSRVTQHILNCNYSYIGMFTYIKNANGHDNI